MSLSDTARLHRRALRLEWLTTLWNVAEAVIAIGAGSVSGSTALIAFGVDSLIEVSSALAVLWRLFKAGPDATFEETEHADRKAHFLVGITFFLLAAYIVVDAFLALLNHAAPESSPIGIALAIVSLVAMPTLAFAKQQTGRQMGSKALQADPPRDLALRLSLGHLAGGPCTQQPHGLVVGGPGRRACHGSVHDLAGSECDPRGAVG